MSNLFPPAPPVSDPYPTAEVFVVRPRRRRRWVHVALFLATVLTTLLAGARMQHNFNQGLSALSLQDGTLPLFPLRWVAEDPARILLGVPFSFTLLLILFAHEMGHYLTALRYGVHATLPFFIPAPLLIGTLGAFIKIQSPIRSRAALFDIGIAGPIAGFVVAVLALSVALPFSRPASPSDYEIVLGFPLVFHAVHALLATLGLQSGQLPLSQASLHPMAIAAWVGMFATALNLLPGGQLDGGHIIYALAPRLHRHLSRVTVTALLTLGVIGVVRQLEVEWGVAILPSGAQSWSGWLLWALIISMMGSRHPHVPEWPGLDRRRRWVALFGLFLLVVTFMPAPLYELVLE
jgi:membrane-associated protease RseP (regulator of RpoE activity)